jgi:hypothetical protein
MIYKTQDKAIPLLMYGDLKHRVFYNKEIKKRNFLKKIQKEILITFVTT